MRNQLEEMDQRKMLAKTDSDLTSSNPGSSPTRGSSHDDHLHHHNQSGPVVYYVQSPSHDDGEKTTNSFHSSPAALSPMGSPASGGGGQVYPSSGGHSHSHSQSQYSNSSLGRNSSSTRFSGSDNKPAVVLLNGGVRTKSHHHLHHKEGRKLGGRRHNGRMNNINNKEESRFDSIEEEESLSLLGEDEDNEYTGLSKRCRYFVGFLGAFIVLFSFFSLVLWAASRNQKPIVTLKTLRYENFMVQSGVDDYGVPTAMTSVNATVRLVYRNRGTFFGVHVASTPVYLYYQTLGLASGTIDKFYQSRSSERTIVVKLGGDRIPVYGAGSDLSSEENGSPSFPIPLTIHFEVRSRAYVLGRLVKPKFRKPIYCNSTMNANDMNKPISLKNSCTYL